MARNDILTDLNLAEIDLDALFTHDDRGRIVRINEPDGGPAPRFRFVRTKVGNTWRTRDDVPDNVARKLDEMAATEPVHDDLGAAPIRLAEMIAALGPRDATDASHRALSYRFPAMIAPPDRIGVTRITRDNLTLLQPMVPDLAWPRAALAAGDIFVAMLVDDRAVSMCFCSRLTDRAAEAGVETLPAFRGRGYAPAVVAVWARAVRASGRIPFYSTSHDNHASRAVARKLGLIQYAGSVSVA